MTLPPFPVDEQTLDLLWLSLHPGPEAERSSLSDFCELVSELAGSDPKAVESEEFGVRVMRDATYHTNDVISALIEEIRRLRSLKG